MHTNIMAAFLETRTPVSMCSVAIATLLIALWAAKADIAQARGLGKVTALSNLEQDISMNVHAGG